MKKEVIIKMLTKQYADDDCSETELLTKGFLYSKDNIFKIVYDDSEVTGFKGCTTSITVKGGNFVSIIRKGAKCNTDLIVESGKKHYCYYSVPYGEMNVGIYTHKVNSTLSADGGNLFIKYTLDVNSSYLSDNEIDIDVKSI